MTTLKSGKSLNHKRVLRIMREDNLLCLRSRPFVPVTTDSRHPWKRYSGIWVTRCSGGAV